MKLKLLFGIYLCFIFQVVFLSSVILASPSRLERNVDQNQLKNLSRNLSVLEMLSLEILLERSIQLGDTKQTQELLTKLFSTIWPQIVNMSISLYDNNFPNEYDNQLEIRNHFARILFIAKLRHCKSPDETFYKPVNRCLPINSEQPCPANMTLNDGLDNLGFCDCSYSKFIYSKQTRRCYSQNSQGPCEKGKWFILVNGNPVCRPVPVGCPADGEHVFWSPNASMAKRCWKMWTQGPCPEDKILIGVGDSNVSCQVKVFPAALSAAPLLVTTKCNPGSYKQQNQKCQPSFF